MHSSPKTRAGRRELTLLPPALEALRQQAPHTYIAGERVFLDPLSGDPWQSSKQLARRWTRILRRAKVRYRNPYQTRHTYASMLLTAGENPMWVAQQMGHRDWGMLRKVYGRWIADAQPDAGAKAAAAMGQNWGKTGTDRDSLRQIDLDDPLENQRFHVAKWRSGRDSNPRPPA
jgi:integrase